MREGGEMEASEKAAADRAAWKWFGNAGHFICGYMCRFHLCTKVGPWLVSTVGQMWSSRSSREIHAKVRDPEWFAANRSRLGDDFDSAYMQRFGYEEIGLDRTFETMVFRAGKPCDEKDCHCGMPRIDGDEQDFAGYKDAGAATAGHHAMCAKWAKKHAPAKAEAGR